MSEKAIVPLAADQEIVVVLSPEMVVTGAPVQRVVSEPASECVAALVSAKAIVALPPLQEVVTGSPVQNVIDVVPLDDGQRGSLVAALGQPRSIPGPLNHDM